MFVDQGLHIYSDNGYISENMSYYDSDQYKKNVNTKINYPKPINLPPLISIIPTKISSSKINIPTEHEMDNELQFFYKLIDKQKDDEIKKIEERVQVAIASEQTELNLKKYRDKKLLLEKKRHQIVGYNSQNRNKNSFLLKNTNPKNTLKKNKQNNKNKPLKDNIQLDFLYKNKPIQYQDLYKLIEVDDDEEENDDYRYLIPTNTEKPFINDKNLDLKKQIKELEIQTKYNNIKIKKNIKKAKKKHLRIPIHYMTYKDRLRQQRFGDKFIPILEKKLNNNEIYKKKIEIQQQTGKRDRDYKKILKYEDAQNKKIILNKIKLICLKLHLDPTYLNNIEPYIKKIFRNKIYWMLKNKHTLLLNKPIDWIFINSLANIYIN
jgi:hypothetical protein